MIALRKVYFKVYLALRAGESMPPTFGLTHGGFGSNFEDMEQLPEGSLAWNWETRRWGHPTDLMNLFPLNPQWEQYSGRRPDWHAPGTVHPARCAAHRDRETG